MAAYFQLFPIGSDVPAKFSDIDDAMCADFGVQPDPDRYYRNWYDCIGYSLAIGNSWDRTRQIFSSLDEICDWMEARYSVNAWMGR